MIQPGRQRNAYDIADDLTLRFWCWLCIFFRYFWINISRQLRRFFLLWLGINRDDPSKGVVLYYVLYIQAFKVYFRYCFAHDIPPLFDSERWQPIQKNSIATHTA
ncbi:hypothetical protein D3C75_1137460 [compost metagenome]